MSSVELSQSHSPVTTVILAGGLGKRIGGDKGLQMLHGKPLISWVLEAVRQESAEILINANSAADDRAREAYASFGYRVIADQLPDWQGPLAGLHTALLSSKNNYVMTVPCDTPLLPADLLSHLQHGMLAQGVEVSVAVAGGRRQPAIALYHKNVLPKLVGYMGAGGRKVNDWLECLQLSEVVFDNVAEFDNINSQEDLALANLMPMAAQCCSRERI
jgi:molybdenum cofactor guanylyltransferase